MSRGVAALVAATLLASCNTVDGQEAREPGPMVRPNLHAWATERAVGDTFTDGLEVLTVTGDEEAVLEGVELVDAEGMEVAGVRLAGPDRTLGSIQMMPWPPRDPELDRSTILPGRDATLLPGEEGASYELLLGIRVTDEGDGYLVRKGIRVDYRVGDEEYSQYFPAALGICTSPDRVDPATGECPLPKGWKSFPEEPPAGQ